LRDTASSHDRLFIIEVMGRDAGFLALEVGLASGADAVIIPEIETDLCQIIDDIHHARDKGKDHFIIVLAEGVMAGQELRDRLRDTGGYDARVSVLGYIVRGGDPTCYDIVLATRMGVKAVNMLLEGSYGFMVGCRGHEMVSIPLRDSWEKKKMIRPEYLRILEIMNS
ncbi:MAG TPA: 6-phosphofructokinase, partial [Synergistales bacterium]|nr:6-phosphofructokinase [Synergistales bacterium]